MNVSNFSSGSIDAGQAGKSGSDGASVSGKRSGSEGVSLGRSLMMRSTGRRKRRRNLNKNTQKHVLSKTLIGAQMLLHGHVDGKALGLEINEEDDEYIIDSESDEEGTAVAIRRSILGYDDSGMGTDQEISFGFTPEQSVFAPRVDV